MRQQSPSSLQTTAARAAILDQPVSSVRYWHFSDIPPALTNVRLSHSIPDIHSAQLRRKAGETRELGWIA